MSNTAELIGAKEFISNPEARPGTVIICPICSQGHVLKKGSVRSHDEESEDLGKSAETDLTLFYTCKGASYLGAALNRLVDNMKIAPAGTPVI